MMILDLGTSNSDTKVKGDEHVVKKSKAKLLYVGLMCFVTNCLSSIALETGSRGSFHSTSSTRFAVYNNLLRRNYNLRIKIMVTNVLASFISTIMLTIGDVYGIPYLYLPWLTTTIEGMTFYGGRTLFALAYTVLRNADTSAGFFTFITLLIYVEEMFIWRDVLVSFKRCWTRYNRNKRLETKRSATMTGNELYGENKDNFDVGEKKSKNQRESINVWKKFINYNTTDFAMRSMENNFSAKNCHRRLSFTEVTG